MMQRLKFLPLLLVFSGLIACSSMDKKSDTPEGAFALAEEFDKDERYEEALRRYTEVKNKFPYSNFATKSELAIADVYFKQESYPEAQVSYQAFRELHPKHPQVDYVMFRVGMSYYNQLPSTLDRDLTVAQDVISSFDEFIKRFPTSQYTKEAGEKRTETLKMLAGKEEYIAAFYFKREMYDSALSRYETLISTYPTLGFDEKALYGATMSANKIGDSFKAQKYLKELMAKFPQSSEAQRAQKEVKL
ncbi:outer membrane protein assembly factor BamD [Bdellovibrio sp. HCB337]|uniref:outer membrane protein assembly factor BamD n=1 Tax=Bdellovibrio sp. HCB337 TaxID=3394358 RepID=UPI0039A77787